MLDFIKEILGAFRQSSLERIKSPFLGAFAFSWLGFNWQLLAVMILSKNDVITRLNYINDKFGIVSLLMGPIFTTVLICAILPTANKLVTKIQRKTNHETNELILQSKIDIAAKQLEIADFEAKKKLAEEREKKNIDADVKAIVANRDQYAESLKEARHTIEAQQKANAELFESERMIRSKTVELDEKIKTMTQENTSLKIELTNHKKDWEKDLGELILVRKELQSLTEESLKASLALKDASDEKYKLMGEIKSLKDQNESLQNEVKKLTKDSAKVFSNGSVIHHSAGLKDALIPNAYDPSLARAAAIAAASPTAKLAKVLPRSDFQDLSPMARATLAAAAASPSTRAASLSTKGDSEPFSVEISESGNVNNTSVLHSKKE